MDSHQQRRDAHNYPEMPGAAQEPNTLIRPRNTVEPEAGIETNNAATYKSSNESSIGLSSQQTATPSLHDDEAVLEQQFSFQDSHLLDIIALILSAGTLLAIVSLLLHFDGKKQPEWKHVSLNTVIAWLSTLSKGCIIFLTSRSIGQLKWLWFANKQQMMSDIRTYDMASRGLLGSSILLFKQKGRHLVSVGCLVFMLSFTFEPFIQNLVHYRSVQIEDSGQGQAALLANTSIYTAHGGFIGGSQYYVDPTFKSNVYASLMNLDPRSEAWSIPQFRCPTGNCTWGPVDILSAEHACTDLTPDLELYCNRSDSKPGLGGIGTNCKLWLPGGPYLRFRSSTKIGLGAVFTIGSRYSQYQYSNSSKMEKFPLMRARYIRATNVDLVGGAWAINFSNSTRWIAKECSLSLCTRRISSTVTNGEYSEFEHDIDDSIKAGRSKTWSTWMDWMGKRLSDIPPLIAPNGEQEFPPHNGDWMQIALQPPPWPGNSSIRTRTLFGLSFAAAISITDFFYGIFSGSFATAGDNLAYYPHKSSLHYYQHSTTQGVAADVVSAIVYSTIPGCESGRESMECALENIAKAVTKTFRDAAFIKYGYDNASMSRGTMTVEQVHVEIQWPWLLVPALIWFLSVRLWSATIWRTLARNIPMWRNNPLPLLWLYRPANESSFLENKSSLAYTRRARKIFGQLYATRDVKEPRID